MKHLSLTQLIGIPDGAESKFPLVSSLPVQAKTHTASTAMSV